jgi:hypothetical protein
MGGSSRKLTLKQEDVFKQNILKINAITRIIGSDEPYLSINLLLR